MPKKSQKEIVLDIVKEYGLLRTEQVEIIGLRKGISGGSSGRYLRWLQEEGLITSYKKEGDATKTWAVIEKPAEPVYRVEGNQLCML